METTKMAASTHAAGVLPQNDLPNSDGAVLKYKNASGKVEEGLKEMLEKINGHLDNLYDDMMARSLKRRATFLSECIQAEVVRQADLMVQLSRLDDVLQKRLERMRAERGEENRESHASSASTAARHREEPQIEDCVEADEEDRPTSMANLSDQPRQEIRGATSDRSSDQKERSLIDQLSDLSFGQTSSRPENPKNDSQSLNDRRREVKPRAVPSTDAQAEPETKVKPAPADPDPKPELTNAPAGQSIASSTGSPAVDQTAQPVLQPLYINPSNLYALAPNATNANQTIGYLTTDGSGTINAAQLSTALLQNAQGQPVYVGTTLPAGQLPLAFANVSTSPSATYVPATLTAGTAGAAYASPYSAYGSAAGTASALKPQTLNINGVPVNGYVLNLQDQGLCQGTGQTYYQTAAAATGQGDQYIAGLKLQPSQQSSYLQSPYSTQQGYYGYPLYSGYPSSSSGYYSSYY